MQRQQREVLLRREERLRVSLYSSISNWRDTYEGIIRRFDLIFFAHPVPVYNPLSCSGVSFGACVAKSTQNILHYDINN
jgi:hypothetical protein